MALVQFAVNNFAALLLGSLIGIERQWRQRNAGLRTNALVALGAEVTAYILASGPQDTQMEKAVRLLSLEPTVTAAGWKHTLQQIDRHTRGGES